jgi:hypothetical protein
MARMGIARPGARAPEDPVDLVGLTQHGVGRFAELVAEDAQLVVVAAAGAVLGPTPAVMGLTRRRPWPVLRGVPAVHRNPGLHVRGRLSVMPRLLGAVEEREGAGRSEERGEFHGGAIVTSRDALDSFASWTAEYAP